MNGRQILSGLGWSTLATAVSAACQIVFMAVLARLLDPAAFGLMAMAAIALRFAGHFSQLGFAQALIQRPVLAAEDTTAALAMATATGVVMYLAMVLAAPLFAAGFRAPELVGLIDVLGLSLLLSPLAGLPLALMRREARFRRVNAIEVAGYVLGYGGAGIVCALRGMGVWSLVAATLCQQTLVLAFGFLALRYPLSWPVRRDACMLLWRFGSRYSLIGFLEFLAGNVETLVIGRLLGRVELGLFNRATTLTNLPVELGVSAVNKVLFPALSGLQQDRQRLADGFQILLLGIGLFSSALACGIAAGAPDVVALLLGAKWISIVPLVMIAAFAVPPTFMYVACGVTLDSLAALGPKLRLQSALLGVKVALLLAFLGHGLPAIACAIVLAEVLRVAAGLRLVARLLEIPLVRIGALLALFAATGLAVWLAVTLAMTVGIAAAWPLFARVCAEAVLGGFALAGALLAIARAYPRYAPLQRFDSVRRWHGRLLATLQPGVA